MGIYVQATARQRPGDPWLQISGRYRKAPPALRWAAQIAAEEPLLTRVVEKRRGECETELWKSR